MDADRSLDLQTFGDNKRPPMTDYKEMKLLFDSQIDRLREAGLFTYLEPRYHLDYETGIISFQLKSMQASDKELVEMYRKLK